jgi:mannose-6-phosphate isomerase-like protein (cupin superfamily)
MQTTILPEHPDAKSPAGADIRFVMACEAGNMIHSTVPPQQVNRATMHATVSELWFVLEGRGEIWRDDGDESCVTALVPGTSVDIPVGTAFQYRNTGDADLTFICVSMPPWPGDSEATYVEGIGRPRSDRTEECFPRACARVRERAGMSPDTTFRVRSDSLRTASPVGFGHGPGANPAYRRVRAYPPGRIGDGA